MMTHVILNDTTGEVVAEGDIQTSKIENSTIIFRNGKWYAFLVRVASNGNAHFKECIPPYELTEF